jgi:hypothetical protein
LSPLFSSNPVSLMSDPSPGHCTDRSADQSSFGSLVIFIVSDDATDHCAGRSSEKRAISRALLSQGQSRNS